MKKIILLLCLLTSLVCSAADEIIKEGISKLTKEEMYGNVGKQILSSNGKYSEYRVISSDRVLGQIILEIKNRVLTGSHWEATIKMRVCIEMKDEKYRISDMGSKISFIMGDEYNSISSYSTHYLEDMEMDLEVIKALFNKDEVDYSSYMDKKDFYGQMLDSTPKYLKPKDEKKNRVNPTYEKYSRIIKACDAVKKEKEHIYDYDIYFLSKSLTEENNF